MLGAVDSTNGNATSLLGSTAGIQGLYLSALSWINGSLSNAVVSKIGAVDTKSIMVI